MHIITHGTSTLEVWWYGCTRFGIWNCVFVEELDFNSVILVHWYKIQHILHMSRIWIPCVMASWCLASANIYLKHSFREDLKTVQVVVTMQQWLWRWHDKKEDISPCRRYSRALKVRSTWKRDDNSPHGRKLLTTQHYIYEVDTKKRWEREKQSLAEKQLWEMVHIVSLFAAVSAIDDHHGSDMSCVQTVRE